MNEQLDNQERTTRIPSKLLKKMRADLKRLQWELDQEKNGKGMLLYIMGWGGDKVAEKDKMLITLHEKVLRAVKMLEASADPSDVLNMLTKEVDFYEAHPTFAAGVTVMSGNSKSEQ